MKNKLFYAFLLLVFLVPFFTPVAAADEQAIDKELEAILSPLQAPPRDRQQLIKLLQTTVSKLESFLQKHPSYSRNIHAYVTLSELYGYVGREQEAFTTIRKTVKLYPTNAQAHIIYFRMLVDKAKEAEARKVGQKLMTLDKSPRMKQFVEAQLSTLKISVGKEAPNFVAKDLKGKKISVEGYRGKVTLIDFWATWCPPCRAEMPNVISVYRKYKKRGFDILGISLDRNENALKSYTKRFKIPWRQYFDGRGWKNKFAAAYGVQSIPKTILLDRKGVIRYVDVRGDALKIAVAKLIKEK